MSRQVLRLLLQSAMLRAAMTPQTAMQAVETAAQRTGGHALTPGASTWARRGWVGLWPQVLAHVAEGDAQALEIIARRTYAFILYKTAASASSSPSGDFPRTAAYAGAAFERLEDDMRADAAERLTFVNWLYNGVLQTDYRRRPPRSPRAPHQRRPRAPPACAVPGASCSPR